MGQRCLVEGCKKEAYPGCGLSFHRLPADEDLRNKWLESLQITRNVSRLSAVCSLHFQKNDYITQANKKLKPGTIPTISPPGRLPPGMPRITLSSSLLTIEPANIPQENDGNESENIPMEIETVDNRSSSPEWTPEHTHGMPGYPRISKSVEKSGGLPINPPASPKKKIKKRSENIPIEIEIVEIRSTIPDRQPEHSERERRKQSDGLLTNADSEIQRLKMQVKGIKAELEHTKKCLLKNKEISKRRLNLIDELRLKRSTVL